MVGSLRMTPSLALSLALSTCRVCVSVERVLASQPEQAWERLLHPPKSRSHELFRLSRLEFRVPNVVRLMMHQCCCCCHQ